MRKYIDIIKFSININDALKEATTTKQWNSTHVEEFKQYVKNELLEIQNYRCCYCNKYLVNDHLMTIDIEHILPKSIYKKLIFDANDNFAIACRKCNFIKSDKTNFLAPHFRVTKYKKANSYRIVHPILDIFKEHFRYFCIIVDDKSLVKYIPLSDKGRFTYKYFNFSLLETSYIDNAQNIKLNELEVSDQIKHIKNALNEVIKNL